MTSFWKMIICAIAASYLVEHGETPLDGFILWGFIGATIYFAIQEIGQLRHDFQDIKERWRNIKKQRGDDV